MGCDIHLVLERRNTQRPAAPWIGVYCSDVHPGSRTRAPVAQRDYAFFAELAGVRGSTKTTTHARNLPEDVSALAWEQYMRAPTDYHNPSHMTVTEFCDAWFRCNTETPDIRKEFAAHDLFGVDGDWPEGFEYRVTFWFDN